VAHRLADLGARVLIHGRARLSGKQVVDQIQAAGHGSQFFYRQTFPRFPKCVASPTRCARTATGSTS